MDIPYEVLVYLFKYLNDSDRKSASESCQSWYLAANDHFFLKQKEIIFYKSMLNDEISSPLKIFVDSSTIFYNYAFIDVEITNKIKMFWDKMGTYVRCLTLKNCDICEKVFVNILQTCSNLEELKIESCKELFMSGRLLEGKSQGLNSINIDNLKTLSLFGNQYLTDALFNRFVKASPNLQVLNLSACSLQFHYGLVKKFYPIGTDIFQSPSESVLTFYFVLEYIKTKARLMKHLLFSKTLIDGAALKAIAEVQDLKLNALEVHSCDQLTNKGIVALTTNQTSLVTLDLGFCSRVTDLSLVHICNNLVNLESLNIQRCRAVTDLGIAELSKLKKLTSINISQCEHITKGGIEKGLCLKENKTLTKLDVHSLNLDQSSVIMMAERFPNLKALDLSFCFNAVTDTSIQIIFKNQVHLQTLKISHCDKVTDAGLTGMGKVETKGEEEIPKMSSIDENSSVQRIHLGSRAEEEIVRDARRKRDVMRMCEELSTDLYTGYSLACIKGLRELDMNGCNRITDVSLTYAFNFKELQNLNLSRCQQITHEGIDHLVKNCSSIEHLNIIDCYNLKDEAVHSIVKNLQRLKTIELRGCNQLTDKTLDSVKAHCKKLKFLDVQGCRNISPELACSIDSIPTLHTVLMSKPGPYISEGLKNRTPAPPFLPALLRRLHLH